LGGFGWIGVLFLSVALYWDFVAPENESPKHVPTGVLCSAIIVALIILAAATFVKMSIWYDEAAEATEHQA
jgi:hypothetical protein